VNLPPCRTPSLPSYCLRAFVGHTDGQSEVRFTWWLCVNWHNKWTRLRVIVKLVHKTYRVNMNVYTLLPCSLFLSQHLCTAVVLTYFYRHDCWHLKAGRFDLSVCRVTPLNIRYLINYISTWLSMYQWSDHIFCPWRNCMVVTITCLFLIQSQDSVALLVVFILPWTTFCQQ